MRYLIPFAFLLAGCGTLTGTAATVDIEKGPPCVIVVELDGNKVTTVTAAKGCEIDHE